MGKKVEFVHIVDTNGNERLFDRGWAVDMSESQMRAMLIEMADVLVTLANAAVAYEEATGAEYDLMAEAVAKAETDIPRGVRGRG